MKNAKLTKINMTVRWLLAISFPAIFRFWLALSIAALRNVMILAIIHSPNERLSFHLLRITSAAKSSRDLSHTAW
jgi:hypothetical protein